MESTQTKMRQVPEDRIKCLTSVVESYEEIADFQVDKIIRDMGFELARKLAEFNKIEIRLFEDRTLLCAKVEIIVPPTPENSWKPKLD